MFGCRKLTGFAAETGAESLLMAAALNMQSLVFSSLGRLNEAESKSFGSFCCLIIY